MNLDVKAGSTQGDFNRRTPAFTLIELVTVIVILGILVVVAIPVYLDYSRDAKISACKGALAGMRVAIAGYNTWSRTDSGGGVSKFPSIAELGTPGVVLQDSIPPNPYDNDGTPNNIVDATGQAKSLIIGTSKGWCYNPANGQIWANSGTKGGGENTY